MKQNLIMPYAAISTQKGPRIAAASITYPISSLSLAEQSGIIFQDGILLD